MKKILAVFLSLTLLAVTVLTTGAITAKASTTIDTWVLFEEVQLKTYTQTPGADPKWGNWDGLTYMAYDMYNIANPEKVNIIKYVATEDGILNFDSTGKSGCKNDYNQWYGGTLEFAILDKNKKVIFPTDGNLAYIDRPVSDSDNCSIPINLTLEVSKDDAVYFYHRFVNGTTQVSFKEEVEVTLNGKKINHSVSLAPHGQSIEKQGEGGWYYMYADTSTVSVMHNDPNGATDFGADRYVASYTAQPMIQNSDSFWVTDTENSCIVTGSIAHPVKGEAIIARFTAPEDGVFCSDYFTVGLNYGYDGEWGTAGHGANFFVANQNGELIVPAYDGVTELRSSGSREGLDACAIFNNVNVHHMKKGDYLDFVIVGLHDYSDGVGLSGDFKFNDGTTKERCDVDGRIFLSKSEEQGARNFSMFYATDLKVEKTTTDAWLEYIRLEKPFTDAPATVEAWVNIPAEVPDYRVGTLISDYADGANDGFTVSADTFGRPRVQYGNGTVDWTVDSVDLRTGSWQHIAFTVDAANNTLSFYLDGELKATTPVTGITAAASNRVSIIGNDHSYATSTAFTGQMKKLALYSDVRSATEIQADMTSVNTSADGLMGYYMLNGVYTDMSTNGNHGTVTTLNNGFYEGELADAEDGEYTVVSMGDQQQIAACYPGAMSSITQWIVDNEDRLNIQAVVNLGDYVMNSTTDGVNSNTKDWEETTAATKLITDAGIPFFFTPGNHEYPWCNNLSRDETHFKKYYPLKDYFSQAEGKDNASTVLYAYPSTEKLTSVDDVRDEMSIANAVYYTKLGGQEYIFFSLEPDTRSEVLNNWANVVMPKLEEEYPNAKTVVITHIYLSPDGNLISGRSYITYNNFVKKYKSISMVLCGHNATGVATRTDYGDNGNKITSIMNDSSYEWNLGNGGEGVLQLFRFKKDGTVKVEYYSALRECYYQTKYQFDLELETEKINQYWLDFDAKEMQYWSDAGIYYAFENNSAVVAHTPWRARVDRNHAVIRTFKAPRDGTFCVKDPSYGAVQAGFSIASSGDDTVSFAVTDDNGKVLWPTDGKPVTMTQGNNYKIELETPVKAGDKIHFVLYNASRDGVEVKCNGFAYLDDWFDDNGMNTDCYLYKGAGASAAEQFKVKNPWYYNYSESISELTYNPNVDLTYKVKGEGGSLDFTHNGTEVAEGKVNMPKGGTIYAYAYPDDGYRVKGIYANGVNVSKKEFYNLVNISEDIDFVVEFERIPVEGDASADGVVDILDLVRMAKTDDYDKLVCDLWDPNNENILDADDLNALRNIILKKLRCGSVDPDREITLADIKETEMSYINKDFSDKIKDGVLNIADCGAEANSLFDYGDLIRSAFRTVINNPGTVLEFEEGTYYVSPVSTEENFVFDFSEDEVRGLHVRGNGCTIMLLDNYVGAFNLSNSKDVLFENMKFDCLEIPYLQAEVKSIDEDSSILTVVADRPSTLFDDPRLERCIGTCFGTVRNKENPSLLKTTTNNYFLFTAVKRVSETEYQFTLSQETYWLTNRNIEVGDKVTLNCRKNSSFIFAIDGADGCTFKDITIYMSNSGGVGASQLRGDLNLKNFRMLPNPKSNNWICSNADGVHIQASRGKVIMENCVFSNLCDDGMNLYQWEGPINQVISSTVVQAGAIGGTMPEVGDTLEVVDCVNQHIIGTAKVKELLPVQGNSIDAEAQVVLETPIEGMMIGDVKGTYFYYIKDKSFVGTTVKNCTFQNIRGRALVLCTTDTVVENCKFINLSNQVMQAWYGRGEGFEVQNLTFQGNYVENCNYLLINADYGEVGQIDIGMHDTVTMEQSQYISHNNITISDNQFIDYNGCAINIKNARNVTVENNFFDLEKQDYPYKKNNAIYINISEDITIRNNVFNDNSENLTAAIRYEESTVNNLTVSDNTYACDKQHEIIKE